MRPLSKRVGDLGVTALFAGALMLAGCSQEGGLRPASEAEPAPRFQQGGLNGGTVRLADFRGEVVLLNFWATWCPYCKKEIPHLIELKRELGDQGLAVIGAALNWQFNSTDPGKPSVFRQKVGAFSLEEGLNYTVALVEEDMEAMLHRFGNPSTTIPYTVLIDRAGRVRRTYQGNPDPAVLRREVRTLLRESEGK
jgi:cytochrome c biogenesis protein CcmG/thiol:disulfide interchange protein DsbE